MQSRLIDLFGGLRGVRDKGAVEAAFSATDTFLRINGLCLNVSAEQGFEFIYGSMDRHEFKFAQILDWIREHIKKLK